MDPNSGAQNSISNGGAAPAHPPSAVMQALQSFQAASEASSKLYRNSSSPHPQMQNQQAQQSGSSTTPLFSHAQANMTTCAPTFNTQQTQAQAFPSIGQQLPPQQQALQGSLQGLSFLMPTGSNDPQQIWLQQALQTLATVQQLQNQQPHMQGTVSAASAPSTTSSGPNAMATTALQPILPAPSNCENAAAAATQQQLLQLHNLLSFPLQLQVPVPAPSPSGIVPQQQLLQQTIGVPPPATLQPPSAMTAPAAVARRPLAPAPAGRSNKRRRENVPKGSNSCPSIISMSNSSSNGGRRAQVNNNDKGYDDEDDKPPQEKSPEELEKMTPNERRRYERNLREQQRSYKISQQIKELRDVLQESNIPFRPNKYSILVSVADYVKQLQGRAVMLDSEHQRLIDTIRHTNDRGASTVSNGCNSMSALSDGQEDMLSSMDGCSTSDGLTPQSHLLFVQGIDYMAIFRHCPYPIGVATLDGRMLDCNQAFEDLLQVEAGSLKDQSFFSFIRNHQEIFHAMAALLKQSSMESEAGLEPKPGQEQLFWNGDLVSQHNARVSQMKCLLVSIFGFISSLTSHIVASFFDSQQFPFTITLTSGEDDNPMFFSLSAAVSLEK